MNLEPEASLARVRRLAWGSLVVFTVIGLWWGGRVSLGVVCGGVLALVNFEAIARVAGQLTARQPGKLSGIGVLGVLFRYILLSAVLFAIISVWQVNVVALALGFSAPVAAVFVECGLHAYQELKAEHE